ncbi:hypothetical protein D3C78_1572210 [compost metagenome]
MKSFLKEDEAISEANKVLDILKGSGRKIKVYFSELEYNKDNDRLVENKLINEDSELLYSA